MPLLACLVLPGAHAIWNVHFFGRQAIEANIIDIINRFGFEAGNIKLPKVASAHLPTCLSAPQGNFPSASARWAMRAANSTTSNASASLSRLSHDLI